MQFPYKYNNRQFERLAFLLEPLEIDLEYNLKEDQIDIRITNLQPGNNMLDWAGYVPIEITETTKKEPVRFSGLNDQIQYEEYIEYGIRVRQDQIEITDRAIDFPVPFPIEPEIVAHYIQAKADQFCSDNQELFIY